MRETAQQTARSVEEEEKVLQVQVQKFSCSHGEDLGEAAVPLHAMEVHGRAEIHLQMEELRAGASGCLKYVVTMGRPC